MKLYRMLAGAVDARLRCLARDDDFPRWQEVADMHQDCADSLVRNLMPSGSGFDNGTQLDWDKSTRERLVFQTAFHHMDQHGGYDGWTDHTVKVNASLVFGLALIVSGRNRNDIKDYIAEAFEHALSSEVTSADA